MMDILESEILVMKVTEKTDGFVWQMGVDEKGFYVRSGGSGKMREFGDFSRASAKRPDYDPLISLRLDTALLYSLGLRSNWFGSRHGGTYRHSICGEMILRIDHSNFCPNGTFYAYLISPCHFIIHTQRRENWYLYEKDYQDLIKLSDESHLSIHDDSLNLHLSVPTSLIKGDTHEEKCKSLETLIRARIAFNSKWGGLAEGLVFHHPRFSFKVMSQKPSLTQLY